MRRLALAAFAVLIVGCGEEPMEPIDDVGSFEAALKAAARPDKPAAQIQAIMSFFDADTGVQQSSFPIATTNAVEIVTGFAGLEPRSTHTVIVKMFTPGGGLYRMWAQSVMADRKGVASTTVVLEVAGTTIEEYAMAGTYRAEAFLDAATVPTVASAFALY